MNSRDTGADLLREIIGFARVRGGRRDGCWVGQSKLTLTTA